MDIRRLCQLVDATNGWREEKCVGFLAEKEKQNILFWVASCYCFAIAKTLNRMEGVGA